MRIRNPAVNNRIRIHLTAGTDPKHSFLGTGTVLEATARETRARVWIRTSTQCCGSGSGLPDHSGFLIIFYDTKKVRKTLISLILTFFYFLSLKTDVNEHPKSTVISKTTLKNNIFFVGSCQPLTKKQDPIQIRIRKSLVRIRIRTKSHGSTTPPVPYR